jgi:hypothetical protein
MESRDLEMSKEPQHHRQESAPEIGGQNGGNKGAKKQLGGATGAVEKKSPCGRWTGNIARPHIDPVLALVAVFADFQDG